MKEGKYFEMAIKIHLRRFTSVFLCCLLVFCSLPVQVHATDPVTAASLAITGGQLAGAGLSGEAALSLAGPVGAVVGVTLGALGVNAYVSQAAQEAGKTRTRFVLDKLVIWGAQAGYTQEQLYSKIAQGISVAADGTIQLTKDVAQMICQFGNWAFTQTDMVVPSISSGESVSSVTINNLSFPVGSFEWDATYQGNTLTEGYVMSSDCAAVILHLSNGIYQPFVFSLLPNQFVTTTGQWSFTEELVRSNYSNGYYRKMLPPVAMSSNYVVNNIPVVELNSIDIDTFFQSLPTNPSWDVSSGAAAADEVFTGTPEAWAENKDVLNPSAEDTPIVLNPDLLNPIIDSLADGQQATMSIIDYLQALQDAWDHALDDVQTAIGTITDSLTGIQEQIAVPQDAVENPTVTNPSVTPDTIPILDPSEVDPGTAITGLSFDLTNIFPFCIPFDIYAALNLLDSEPVAPSYHVHLEWPYNIIIDFTIDLSPFNDVAAVARTMETLLFIVGLAVMTRSMFIRG